MDLKPDHPKTAVDAPVLLILTILLTIALQKLLPLPFPLATLPSRILGAILFLGGFALGFPALRGMLKAKTSPNPHQPTNALVFDATYRITRNPMYLGMLINYSGLSIFFQNLWFAPLLLVLIWLFTTLVIIPEEEYLEGKFGKEYLDFKTHIRRWI